jgi:hypothetical protein
MAPESYLGVGHWSEPAGGRAEPTVVMRRYPDSRRLATLVKYGWTKRSASRAPGRQAPRTRPRTLPGIRQLRTTSTEYAVRPKKDWLAEPTIRAM